MKLHVDYDWSVKKLAESPDDEECDAGKPVCPIHGPFVPQPGCVYCFPQPQLPVQGDDHG